MSEDKINKTEDLIADEEMFVTMDFEDGTEVTCSVSTILTVRDHDYIALLPLDEEGVNNTGEVWFYGYSENKDDPNEEPVLSEITDDSLYEEIGEAYDEFMDSIDFDKMEGI